MPALTPEETVWLIRSICAAELHRQFDYPFFQADYLPGESADEALLRLFKAERIHHRNGYETVLALCHG